MPDHLLGVGLEPALTATLERVTGLPVEPARPRSVAVPARDLFVPAEVADACRRAEAAALVAMEYLAAPGLRGIVLDADTFGLGRALCAQATVPTVLIPHAILPRPRSPRRWDGSTVFAKHVCAPGLFSARTYRVHGAQSVFLTGRPAWDGYATLDREAAAAQARLEFSLTRKKPLIVYGGTWLERSTAHASRHIPALLQVFRDICRTCRMTDAQLVVKLHPGEVVRCGNVAALVNGYEAVAKSQGLHDVVVTAGHKVGLLCAASLVIAMNSNLLLEGLLCGTPGLNVPLVPEDAGVLFGEAGGGIWNVDDPAHVGAELTRLITRRLWHAMREHVDGTIARYVHQPDGKAGERVAAVVADLISH